MLRTIKCMSGLKWMAMSKSKADAATIHIVIQSWFCFHCCSYVAGNLQFIGRVQIEIALQLMIIYRRFMHFPIPISVHTENTKITCTHLFMDSYSQSSIILASCTSYLAGYCAPHSSHLFPRHTTAAWGVIKLSTATTTPSNNNEFIAL